MTQSSTSIGRSVCGSIFAAIVIMGVASLLAQEPAEPAAVNNAPALRIRAEAGDTVLKLSWDPPPGVEVAEYRVFAFDNEKPIAVVRSPAFEDIGLSNAKTYRYRIVAMLAGGEEWKGYRPIAATPQSRSVGADEVFGDDEHVLARFEFNGQASDVSGHERHGRLLGGEFVDTPWGQGLLVRAANEVGLDWSDYAELLKAPYTVEIILTPRLTDSWGKLFSFNDEVDRGWYYKNRGIQAYPNEVLASGEAAPDGRHYVAFVATQPDRIDVFFQGKNVGSTEATFSAPPAQAIFFRDDSSTGRGEQIDAVIEALRISNIARTAEELAVVQARLE